MSDHSNDNQQPDFIREKIVKKKDSGEISRFLGKSAAGGAVFGLAAGLVFAFCTWCSSSSLPKTTITEESESSPEETQISSADGLPRTKEELETLVSRIVKENTSQEKTDFYESIRESVESLQDSMVTVISVKKDVDWFAVSYDSQYVQSGLLIKRTADKYYILTGYKNLSSADQIQTEFDSGKTVEAKLVGYDTVYDVAILSIERKNLTASQEEQISTVTVGNSMELTPGSPVFAIGSPGEEEGSVGIGFVSYLDEQLELTDSVIRGIESSVPIDGTGYSFLMNLKGELVGVFTNASQNLGSGYSQAYGINDLMVYVSRIYEGKETAGLGITGQDIEESVREKNQLPEGIYVTDVLKDSASYTAGVQAGDVLGELDGHKITSMEEYEDVLMELTPGREVKVTVYRNSQGAYKKMELKITPTIRQG